MSDPEHTAGEVDWATEGVLDWAVRTHRVAASRREFFRDQLMAGRTTAASIRLLEPVDLTGLELPSSRPATPAESLGWWPAAPSAPTAGQPVQAAVAPTRASATPLPPSVPPSGALMSGDGWFLQGGHMGVGEPQPWPGVKPTSRPAAAVAASTPRAAVRGASWATEQRNPLAAAARAAHPDAYTAALAVAPVPTLFAGGDTPPFTASGIDPQHLLTAPWQARHAIASAGSSGEALDLVQRYTAPGGDALAAAERGADPGNSNYFYNVSHWLMTGMEPGDAMRVANLAGDDFGRAIFEPQARGSAVAASAAVFPGGTRSTTSLPTSTTSPWPSLGRP